MAILVKFDVAGMDSTKHNETIRQLEEAGQGNAAVRIHHLCYGDKTNLQVNDVFESRAKLDAFATTLVPILQSPGIEEKPAIFEVYCSIEGHQ